MLVLSRKESESVMIYVPPSTETQIIQIDIPKILAGSVGKSPRIRLGFEADKSIRIIRKEIDDLRTTN